MEICQEQSFKYYGGSPAFGTKPTFTTQPNGKNSNFDM
jgi:hypothetical protein